MIAEDAPQSRGEPEGNDTFGETEDDGFVGFWGEGTGPSMVCVCMYVLCTPSVIGTTMFIVCIVYDNSAVTKDRHYNLPHLSLDRKVAAPFHCPRI
jgi:hypothetical protein